VGGGEGTSTGGGIIFILDYDLVLGVSHVDHYSWLLSLFKHLFE